MDHGIGVQDEVRYLVWHNVEHELDGQVSQKQVFFQVLLHAWSLDMAM